MAYYCSDCTYLDITSEEYGKFWCEARLERHGANEISCYRFCKASLRESNVAESAYNYSEEHSNSGSGCYLTTIICNILGLPDNNDYLETLRQFRDNVLQKNEAYKGLLVEYDIIGPKISQALNNDPMKQIIVKRFFINYIVTISNLIKNKANDSAVYLYIEMTNKLKKLYNINNIGITSIEINNADIKKSGHGIYVKKKTIFE